MSRPLMLASIALVIASVLGAQETPSTIMWGLGTTLNPAALVISDLNNLSTFPTGFNNILFPIRAQGFTVEPEFGLFRTSSSQSVQTGASSFSTNTNTFSNVRLGVGVLKHMEKRDNLEPYYGPRLGVIRSTNTDHLAFNNSDITTTTNSWYLSGVVGAQYFFSKHFSLGGEAQLTYTGIGTPSVSGASSNQPDASQNSIGTASLVMLRCYY